MTNESLSLLIANIGLVVICAAIMLIVGEVWRK